MRLRHTLDVHVWSLRYATSALREKWNRWPSGTALLVQSDGRCWSRCVKLVRVLAGRAELIVESRRRCIVACALNDVGNALVLQSHCRLLMQVILMLLLMLLTMLLLNRCDTTVGNRLGHGTIRLACLLDRLIGIQLKVPVELELMLLGRWLLCRKARGTGGKPC